MQHFVEECTYISLNKVSPDPFSLLLICKHRINFCHSHFNIGELDTLLQFYKNVILSCTLPWPPITSSHPTRKKKIQEAQPTACSEWMHSECTVPVPRIPCDKLQKESQNKQKNIYPVSINWLDNTPELRMETHLCKIPAVTPSKSIPLMWSQYQVMHDLWGMPSRIKCFHKSKI